MEMKFAILGGERASNARRNIVCDAALAEVSSTLVCLK